jgi:ABC-type amino acid transport substrate-binding protein
MLAAVGIVARRYRGLLCFFALLYAFGAPAAPATAPSVRVVTDNNYPPYVVVNADGQPEGYIVDLWRLWERKTGVQVEFKAMQWAEAQRSMHKGQADVIDLIFRTPVRDQLYDFSQPHATLPVNIYVDTSIHGVRGPKELAGFTVGVQRGDACVDKLASLGISSLAAFENYESILAAARAGEIKMFCMDEVPANYYLYLHRDQLRFSQAFRLYEGQFHWAVTKGDQATFALVNRGMSLITSEERDALQSKWFSQPFEFRPYLRMLLFGLLGVLAALSAAGLWIWLLRRSVRARTAEIRMANRALQAEKA